VTTPIILRMLVAILLPAAAHAACVVENKATIPLEPAGGVFTVPVEVNGIAATFMLDTGALRSTVTPEAVQRLSLARDKWSGTTMTGIGGIGAVEHPPNANPTSISLGGVALVRRLLSRDSSLAVSVLPGAAAGSLVIDGLLGGDFLSVFDLDLDIPGRRLTLYQTRDCTGRFLPWSGNYDVVGATITVDNAVYVEPLVDGKKLRALLDTGASASLLAAPGMYKLGLDQARLSSDRADRISGLGPRSVTVHRHRFKSLRVGNQTIDSPLIWVEPIRLPRLADMVLGIDWIAGQRVWISYATKQLFVAAP
jgi:hypothetical protein